MVRFAGWRIVVVGILFALVCAGAAWAFQQLPTGGLVNDDFANGIDRTHNVSGGDPTNADVVGGSLTATTGKAVPWAIFQQTTTGSDQVFVRSFAGGAWLTRGSGTVGGRSDASPTSPSSLNFDRTTDGEVPAIDFAGTGRTVPWATWYEDTSGTDFGAKNIFASRFDNASGKWTFAGQGRGNGGSGPQVPSLNIHTNRDAENPSVAGGATAAGNAPVPWITWQEVDGGPQQIFTSKAVKSSTGTTCPDDLTNGPIKPPPAAGQGAIGGFCWQQVGLDRVASGAGALPAVSTDPSMNVDPTRDGIEPDIAFTGPNDAVPWVVWYETGPSGLGLQNNETVFAAKATLNTAADGQFQWTVVGSQLQGLLDASATTAPIHQLGVCAESTDNEQHCSLNKVGTADAEDPRVAAGTMTPGAATVPWVVWDESNGTHTQVFVSRLVGSGATAQFEVANNGAAISVADNDSTRPDITFSGNTPYVSWREDTGGGVTKGFFGHFVLDGTGIPIFHLDESNVPLAPTGSGAGQADVREPISSGCTANPVNLDGATCQGSAIGTPFFLFTNVNPPPPTLLSMFSGAYQPDTPVTGTSSAVTSSTATVSGLVNPEGGPVNVSFDFGTSTAYDHTTAGQKLSPANASTPFAANLTGLAASTTIHYRSVATTDFGTFVGGDQTLTTAAAPDTTPPTLTLKIVKSTVKKLLKSGKLKVKVTLSEAGKVKLSASTKVPARHHKHKTVGLGRASKSFSAAGSKTVSITLPATAASKLRRLHKGITIKVTGQATDTAGNKSKKKTASGFFKRR